MTAPTTTRVIRFAWLHLTDTCQLECRHCATDSGPTRTHGTMTEQDWRAVIDEAATLGVRKIQMVGGEPTLHPDLTALITHTLGHGIEVEVFTNLVHVTDDQWTVFQQPGVTLATSYYSDDPDQHNTITARPTHARTKANIRKARDLGIPLRVGVIDLGQGQRTSEARTELLTIGVRDPGYDQVRGLGRAACGTGENATELCGRCGDGVLAVTPDGTVRPCLFATWATAGNVKNGDALTHIADILPTVRETLTTQGMPAPTVHTKCMPQGGGGDCYPYND